MVLADREHEELQPALDCTAEDTMAVQLPVNGLIAFCCKGPANGKGS